MEPICCPEGWLEIAVLRCAKSQNSTDLVLYTKFHVDLYINIKLRFDVLTAVTKRYSVFLDVT